LGDSPDGFGHKFCFVVRFLSESSLAFDMPRKALSDAGLKLVTEPAEGHVSYFSPHSGKRIDETLALVATFVMSGSVDCVSKFLPERQ
jgi:hypothetical protein